MQRNHISMSSSSMSFSSANPNPRRRDHSGELDVFDATLYFSGGADNLQQGPDRRRSLDASLGAMQKLKQCKKTSSPGGRLASFLVSFFHHTSSKRRSKLITRTSSFAKEVDPKEKNSYAARWRRNSVGHYESANEYMPMAYAKAAPGAAGRGCTMSYPCEQTEERAGKNGHEGFGHSLYKEDPLWAEVFAGKQMWREEDEEEDSESESSSDLFELKNYDLGVGGTTELDSIERGSAIASAAS